MVPIKLRIAAGALAAATGGVGFYAYRSANPSQQTAQISTASASRTDISETVAASGSVAAATERALSFAGTGKITAIKVALGDHVAAGQTLASLDATTAQTQVIQAKSSLVTAQAKVDLLRSGLTPDERRQLDLAAVQSRQQVANAKQAMVQAKATVGQASVGYNAQVAQAQTTLDGANATAATNAATAQVQVDAAQTALDNAKANVSFSAKTYQAQVDTAQTAVDNANTTAALDAKSAQTSVSQAATGAVNAQKNAGLDQVSAQTSLDQANAALAAQQAALGQTVTDSAFAQSNLSLVLSADAGASTAATRSAVVSAQSALNSAQAKVTSQQAAITSASNQVTNAQNNLNATLEKGRQSLASAQDGSLATAANTQAATATKDQQQIASAQTSLQSALNNQASSLAKDQQQTASLDSALKTALANQAASRTKDQQQIAAARTGLVTARNGVASSVLKDSQSIANSANQITSSEQGLQNTVLANKIKLAPAKTADLVTAQASLDQAKAALTTAQKALDDTILKAPIAGTITVLNAHVGDSAGGQLAPMTLTDTDNLIVTAGFSEANAAKVKAGQPAAITLDALPDVSLDATVASIDSTSTTVQNVVNYLVHFTLPSEAKGQGVKPGMTAQTEVTTQAVTNVVALPSAAIRSFGTNHVVTVLDPATKAQTRTQVEVGLVGGGNTEIVSGLSEGATVVIPQIQTATGAGARAGTGARAGAGGLAGGLTGGGALGGGGFGGGGRG